MVRSDGRDEAELRAAAAGGDVAAEVELGLLFGGRGVAALVHDVHDLPLSTAKFGNQAFGVHEKFGVTSLQVEGEN